jgi:hypothetical protein
MQGRGTTEPQAAGIGRKQGRAEGREEDKARKKRKPKKMTCGS